jgi:hypothetical protein
MAITRLGGANAITGTIPTSVAPGQGKLLQIQSDNSRSAGSTSSTTPVDYGMTCSITPNSTSNPIYIRTFLPDCRNSGTTTVNTVIHLYRQINGGGYSDLIKLTNGLLYNFDSQRVTLGFSGEFKDTTHNTTSQIDYKIYFKSGNSSYAQQINCDAQGEATLTAMEIQG